MAFISFSKTKKEYLAGIKTVTRRNWKQAHFEMWRGLWDKGELIHAAWSQLPFIEGAHKMGKFMLVVRPYMERVCHMPDYDLIYEGDLCNTSEEFAEIVGVPHTKKVAVIRFIPLTFPETACKQVLDWLERIYPESVFTGISGDPGPVRIALIRLLIRYQVRVHGYKELA